MTLTARAILLAAIRSYRWLLSPWLGNQCRFAPTCSAYALDAVALHGAALGSALMVGRIARCHPWCAGGLDPVPAATPPFFTALLGRARERDAALRAVVEPRP